MPNKKQEQSTDPGVLILGIGNFLLGDEGIGVHAIREMQEMDWPENVTLLDGGTGGFHLLEHIESYPKVIMLDATLDGNEPGTIVLRRPKFANDFPPSLSAHDIGLRDLVNALVLLEKLPDINLLTITAKEIRNVSTELTPEIKAVIPQLITEVRKLLKEIS